VATSTPSHTSSSIRTTPTTVIRILAAWAEARNSDTSLIASPSVTAPSRQVARIRSGYSVTGWASRMRCGRSSDR
jgi:hypothetical protein